VVEGAGDGSGPPTGVKPGEAPDPAGTRKATLGDLLVELRRRRVFRVIVGYGIFSFAVLQVTEPVLHAYDLPVWVLTAVVTGLVVGFPSAIILSWLYDLTAQGVKRTPTATGSGLRAVRRSSLVAMLAGVAVLAALPILGWYAWQRTSERRSGALAPVGTPSVAVLPFANLSGDPAQDYFSDGMTEEITGKLARLRNLAVAAGSSVARYRKSTAGPREIGAELGVAHVLEGSVRRSGDRIRVSARLVKTANAFRVWTEDFDATVDDIFAVQERVATRIVEALGVHLAPGESRTLTDWGTRNAAAYDEYLRGIAEVEHFYDRPRLESGRGHLERALAIDPNFAPALAGMADVEIELHRNFDGDPERLVRAEAAARRALELDPRLSLGRINLAAVKANRYDYDGTARELRTVTTDDKRNYIAWDRLCWVLGYAEPPQAVEGERACRRALEINPAYGEAYYHLVRCSPTREGMPRRARPSQRCSKPRPARA